MRTTRLGSSLTEDVQSWDSRVCECCTVSKATEVVKGDRLCSECATWRRRQLATQVR